MNEQIKRDEDLLKIIEEREKEIEKILLHKANALVNCTGNTKKKSGL